MKAQAAPWHCHWSHLSVNDDRVALVKSRVRTASRNGEEHLAWLHQGCGHQLNQSQPHQPAPACGFSAPSTCDLSHSGGRAWVHAPTAVCHSRAWRSRGRRWGQSAGGHAAVPYRQLQHGRQRGGQPAQGARPTATPSFSVQAGQARQHWHARASRRCGAASHFVLTACTAQLGPTGQAPDTAMVHRQQSLQLPAMAPSPYPPHLCMSAWRSTSNFCSYTGSVSGSRGRVDVAPAPAPPMLPG